MKESVRFIRFVVGLLAPFVLIFGGAGLIGIGFEYDYNVLVWAGGIVAICGLLWGLLDSFARRALFLVGLVPESRLSG